MPYRRNKTTGVYCREKLVELQYSDGEKTERELLQFLLGVSDLGTFSEEIKEGVCDWPTEYHLGIFRHHLLRPLPVQRGERVLELGCGCGALTRYLGEIGAAVTAVEGSWTRACIAAERCRDLENVRVVCDDLLQFVDHTHYDWVLLIGVLEYAPVFSDEPEPVQHYLRTAKQHLAAQGRLVVAIENRLGLKYFNGCTEDHVGTAYFGLHDMYGPKTPVTFGRRELTEQMQQTGFNGLSYYYPFPDYKIPQVIFSENAFHEPDFRAADMLLRLEARDYSGQKIQRVFHEALVVRTLEKNGLLQDFSNSFLLVATEKEMKTDENQELLAMTFSSARSARLLTETIFFKDSGVLCLKKRRTLPLKAIPKLSVAGFTVMHQELQGPYYYGKQCSEAILKMQLSTRELSKIAETFVPWLGYLRSQATCMPDSNRKKLADWLLPGDKIDCTPDNLLTTGDLEAPFREIDKEWKTTTPVPLGWVITRGVIHCLTQPKKSKVAAIVRYLGERIGLDCRVADVYGWIHLEDELQAVISGKEAKCHTFFQYLRMQAGCWITVLCKNALYVLRCR